jgi:DNA-binding cell septation regulator SpoVG
MDLDALQIVSDKVILANINKRFAAFEGDKEESERVWVIVTQATEEDHRKRAGLTARREAAYTLSEDGKLTSANEAVTENVYERIMLEVHATLRDVGNLVRGDKPVFPTMPAKSMKRADFEKIWGKLPPILCEAIHDVVRSMNPDWDWERGKSSQST